MLLMSILPFLTSAARFSSMAAFVVAIPALYSFRRQRLIPLLVSILGSKSVLGSLFRDGIKCAA
jgi:hypothetical protein